MIQIDLKKLRFYYISQYVKRNKSSRKEANKAYLSIRENPTLLSKEIDSYINSLITNSYNRKDTHITIKYKKHNKLTTLKINIPLHIYTLNKETSISMIHSIILNEINSCTQH